ncbi:MAG: YciI family protein [Acidobacteriota bacterium]
MAKFMFLHRGECGGSAERSPEEMQTAMQAMQAWMERGQSEGWLLDAGDGLKPEGRVVRGDTVTDGPFAESKELVGGYCMVEAADLPAAAELARSMPLSGDTIEVRELMGHSME